MIEDTVIWVHGTYYRGALPKWDFGIFCKMSKEITIYF